MLYVLDKDDEPKWNSLISEVEIESSADEENQEAYLFKSDKTSPLIVSLHQWSTSFDKYDELSELVIDAGWNYIRPNFRGPSNNPDACGSDLVVSDIDDAIQYAIDNGNVDTSQIHIVGASGGGHASLMHFMKSNVEVNSYSVWVPVTDLVSWYGESVVRDNSYSEDVLQCTGSVDILNIDESKKRSPLYLKTPVDKFDETSIHIFAGINDGYNGAVPISHSINFYNKVIDDLGLSESDKVPFDKSEEMIHTKNLKETSSMKLGDRDLIYEKSIDNLSINIFDGGHEILNHEAFNLIQKNHPETN